MKILLVDLNEISFGSSQIYKDFNLDDLINVISLNMAGFRYLFMIVKNMWWFYYGVIFLYLKIVNMRDQYC